MPVDGCAGITIERRANDVGKRGEIDRFGMQDAVAIGKMMHGMCLEEDLKKLKSGRPFWPDPSPANGACSLSQQRIEDEATFLTGRGDRVALGVEAAFGGGVLRRAWRRRPVRLGLPTPRRPPGSAPP